MTIVEPSCGGVTERRNVFMCWLDDRIVVGIVADPDQHPYLSNGFDGTIAGSNGIQFIKSVDTEWAHTIFPHTAPFGLKYLLVYVEKIQKEMERDVEELKRKCLVQVLSCLRQRFFLHLRIEIGVFFQHFIYRLFCFDLSGFGNTIKGNI
ncbi:hypothetical protein LXL04_036520 [Taraxacum kok-saghyz]